VRILQLSWEYPPLVYGGLGRHVHALAEAQAAAGHEVTVLTQHVEGAAYDEVVAGVRVVRVPYDPPLIPRDDLLAWVSGLNHPIARAGLRLADELLPQVVHAHDWLMCQAGTTLKEALDLPLVATMHATEAGRHQGWLPGPLSKAIHTTEWWLTFEARRVITCSQHMSDEVVRLFDLPPDKVDVVPGGIDLDRWSVPAERVRAARDRFAGAGPLIVFAGRLEWEKGVHTLLDAMPRLRRRFPGVRLVIAGQGTHADDLRALAVRRRLGRSVQWAGFLAEDELAALAAAADCALIPSIYEPFGLVALEAAAAGTPLVVADTGGLREFVEHGVTGLRFAAGDVAALADAITAVLSDELLARRLSRSARQVLQRDYAWSGIAERTTKIYEQAVREEWALQAGLSARAERPLRVVLREGNQFTGQLS